MATIEARGYVNHLEVKTSKGGNTYQTFSLGVKQKKKAYGSQPEQITWANFQVTDFGGTELADRNYVTVKGYLTVKDVEKDGSKRTFLEVKATEIEVAPPFEGAEQNAPAPKAATKPKPKAPVKDDFADDDMPF